LISRAALTGNALTGNAPTGNAPTGNAPTSRTATREEGWVGLGVACNESTNLWTAKIYKYVMFYNNIFELLNI